MISEEIERYFFLADAVEEALDNGLNQSDRLRQSILKKAFAGGLVPQDPADEPAEKLLERIRKEKAGHMTTGRKTKGERANRKLF